MVKVKLNFWKISKLMNMKVYISKKITVKVRAKLSEFRWEKFESWCKIEYNLMAKLFNCSLKLLGSSKSLQAALSSTFEKGWKISKITKKNRIWEFGKSVRNCLNSGKFLHIFNPSQICSSCDFEKQSPSKFNHSEPIDLSNTRNCHGLEHRNFFYRIIGKSSKKNT